MLSKTVTEGGENRVASYFPGQGFEPANPPYGDEVANSAPLS